MKKLLISMLLGASSCAGSNHHMANSLVSAYAKQISPNPASYRPISFDPPGPVELGDMITNQRGVKTLPGAFIKHTYWAQDKSGEVKQNTTYFVVDSTTQKVELAENVIRRESLKGLKSILQDGEIGRRQ
jgi:hypothetical protein